MWVFGVATATIKSGTREGRNTSGGKRAQRGVKGDGVDGVRRVLAYLFGAVALEGKLAGLGLRAVREVLYRHSPLHRTDRVPLQSTRT